MGPENIQKGHMLIKVWKTYIETLALKEKEVHLSYRKKFAGSQQTQSTIDSPKNHRTHVLAASRFPTITDFAERSPRGKK